MCATTCQAHADTVNSLVLRESTSQCGQLRVPHTVYIYVCIYIHVPVYTLYIHVHVYTCTCTLMSMGCEMHTVDLATCMSIAQ